MSVMDEREYIAAERALKLEPLSGESPEDARLREDWERRLAPLLEAEAAAPPPGLFARIEAEIDRAASGTSANAGTEIIELSALRRQVRRWKAATGFALAAAAALAIYVATPRAPDRYVALVTADDGGEAGLIIQFDTGSNVATVIPVVAPPPGNSYEMWTIPEGRTRPVSLGLLPKAAVSRSQFTAAPGQIFAISLEPEGGSPTGQPTQPQFHGTLVKVE